ncbi:MAG: hypothetical protein K2K86_07675 [Muribaculaceae bacterium]|nr:hypothetical protein [Muribaculaceae bacterium]
MKILYSEQQVCAPTDEPIVSLLTDSSVSRNHKPLFVPPHHDRWTMSIGLGLRVSRLGKFVAPKFASRYYDAMTLVARLRPATVTMPASATDIAFDSSIVIGEWLPIPTDTDPLELTITANDNEVAVAVSRELIDNTVARMSRYFMIKHGDVIVPGDLPMPSHDVVIDSQVDITLDRSTCLHFKIK